MKKTTWNVMCAASVLACGLLFGCDDNSASPQENVLQSSSSADVLGSGAGNNLSSSAALSSAENPVVESSSSVATSKTLCRIDMTTMQGYYPMAYNISKVSFCLPMDNCDSLTLELGFAKCHNNEATVEGCYSMASPKVVEACDESYDETCETRNGTAYVYGALRLNCRNIVR